MLGDGQALSAIGRGDVVLDIVLPNGEFNLSTLHDVLYVPELSYISLSLTNASQKGKIVSLPIISNTKRIGWLPKPLR